MSREVVCSNCGMLINKGEGPIDSLPDPCASCGSIARTVKLVICEKLELHEALKGKVKDKNFPSKKNPRREFFVGDEIRASDSKWMKKERNIDKDNDKYREVVVNPENGELVHHCEESLKDHIGHGSAKIKKN
ncbi:hypothetical protein Geob_2588 [Geotalea daltonii FRC-32]|uniref:Uncharacterized protein n=1 Tax=Geotalea daltonii (strain DSM 22248 / JCM 15807 / FRC-32) TaxID=316067 RepID=B9M0T5_GEODF|nr:hypothetical protein [Geotalea daltonii]ACM20938.1 hypothetical protein Geob_2588 [Geotalea daltonii FRC-32]